MLGTSGVKSSNMTWPYLADRLGGEINHIDLISVTIKALGSDEASGAFVRPAG